MRDLKELFVDELRDILSAEKQLIEGVAKNGESGHLCKAEPRI